MRLAIALTCALVLASIAAHAVDIPTFAMTPDELKTKLNAVIKADTTQGSADILSKCDKRGTDQVCSFRDESFQRSVSGFKKLNLVNERFTKAVRLEITAVNGMVTELRLIGSRRDPMNILDFLSSVVDAAKVFDPKAGADDLSLKAFVDELGLMRGDDAKDIGRQRMIIEPYAQISCLAVDSHISSDVECAFISRS